MAYHSVAAAKENGDCTRVLTLLDDEHALVGGAETDFADDTRFAQLLRVQLLEARHDATASGHRDQLQSICASYSRVNYSY